MLQVILQQLIDALFPPQCGGCDEPGTGACERCFPAGGISYARLPTLRVAALAAYEGNVRRAVLALKNGRRDVAQTFAERLCRFVPAGTVLVPVPTTAARKRQRGFDGCELIAHIIAARTGAEVYPYLRQITGDRQRGRSRDARLSARGRFAWRGEPLGGQTIVLLDDVLTTGTTLEDCAHALRGAGAIAREAIVVARA